MKATMRNFKKFYHPAMSCKLARDKLMPRADLRRFGDGNIDTDV